MHDLGCLAVDGTRRTHDPGTERCRDHLMAQADPQQRSGGATHAHDIYADARVSGGTWSRGDHDACRGEGSDLIRGHLVVPHDLHVAATGEQHVREVVGEGVIVVYEH